MCISGSIFSNAPESKSYRYRVTDLLISIRANIIYHPIIKQLLDNHKINYEVLTQSVILFACMLNYIYNIYHYFLYYRFMCKKVMNDSDAT